MIDLTKLIDLAQCSRLSKKYKGIVALPLALPKFELDSIDQFWKIWNEEVEAVERQHIDRGAEGIPNPGLKFTQWDGLAMYEDQELLGKAAWKTKVSASLAETQSNFIKTIFDNLPFTKIRSIRLWSANKTIPAHYDGNMPKTLDGVLHFPAEIRIMIDDKNPTETFWLVSVKKYSAGTFGDNVDIEDRFYVKLPNDTNTFAWNNEDYLHGADFNPQYRKILVVIKGWIDVSKLEILLDASLEKYSEFILREKND